MLEGWGRVRRSASVTLTPDDVLAVGGCFANPRAHGLIVHGAGRAYGDCALNDQGSALMTAGLTGILAFDPDTGIVQVEPGVTFRQLMAEFLPRGFLVPVTPGTGFATIGGAVANDVHGKNHETAGSFAQHVTELDLLTPAGGVRTIGPDREPTLFRATCGGLGLTGVITRVAFRMARVAGPAVRVREQRVGNLEAFLAALDAAAGATYAVGWIDGTARGAALGRGILETAEPVAGHPPAPGGGLRVPVDFPAWVLSPLSIRAFNELYFRRVPAGGRTRIAHVGKFFYPLDALRGWNRIYGKRGFHQFQNVVPFSGGAAALRELLEVIGQSRRASFLAVLKRLGGGILPEGEAGHLSFPQPGYTLALDFPAGPGIEDLYARLVAITLRHGGRVYLAKDALLDAAAFRQMYPLWGEFRGVLEGVDPKRRLQSDMSRRLRLREAA
jgi:decaprenylphospho-beta-D-ribofuranose 2-oxidase